MRSLCTFIVALPLCAQVAISPAGLWHKRPSYLAIACNNTTADKVYTGAAVRLSAIANKIQPLSHAATIVAIQEVDNPAWWQFGSRVAEEGGGIFAGMLATESIKIKEVRIKAPLIAVTVALPIVLRLVKGAKPRIVAPADLLPVEFSVPTGQCSEFMFLGAK